MQGHQAENEREIVLAEDIALEDASGRQPLPTESQENQADIKRSIDIPSNTNTIQPQAQQDEESKQLVVDPTDLPLQDNCLSYGKNLVLIKSKYLTLFLGPDYFCFLATFIIFALVSFFLIRYIDTTSQNNWAKVITKIICIGHCLSYLLVALSDPGIARPITEEKKAKVGRTIFCRKCRYHVPSRTIHCQYCDVCIEGYDHHCPWTSKCIGRNNLVRFYIFLFMTPIFIVYCALAFGFTLQGTEHTPNLRVASKP